MDPQDILDNISTGVIALDDSLCVTAMNAAGQALLETSESRAIGSPASDLIVDEGEWLETLHESP